MSSGEMGNADTPEPTTDLEPPETDPEFKDAGEPAEGRLIPKARAARRRVSAHGRRSRTTRKPTGRRPRRRTRRGAPALSSGQPVGGGWHLRQPGGGPPGRAAVRYGSRRTRHDGAGRPRALVSRGRREPRCGRADPPGRRAGRRDGGDGAARLERRDECRPPRGGSAGRGGEQHARPGDRAAAHGGGRTSRAREWAHAVVADDT